MPAVRRPRVRSLRTVVRKNSEMWSENFSEIGVERALHGFTEHTQNVAIETLKLLPLNRPKSDETGIEDLGAPVSQNIGRYRMHQLM